MPSCSKYRRDALWNASDPRTVSMRIFHLPRVFHTFLSYCIPNFVHFPNVLVAGLKHIRVSMEHDSSYSHLHELKDGYLLFADTNIV